jgi:hypothetical protein
MAKRFTDTEKWKDDWYINLDNNDRVVWQWLLDNCNHAGICKRSITVLNLMCRVNYTEDQMLKKMENRVLLVKNIWFIPKFLKFQYNTLLNGRPVALSVVKELFANDLIKYISEDFGNHYKIISESFENHCQIIKDKDKDKDKEYNSKGYKTKEGESEGDLVFGKYFSDEKNALLMSDDTFMEISEKQKQAIKSGKLKPYKILKN